MTDTPPANTMQGVVPYLMPSDANGAIDFYKKVFDAVEVARMPADDGKRLMHAHITVNGGPMMMSDSFPEHGYAPEKPQAIILHLQVAEPQAWWDRAVGAGGTVVSPMVKQFWGDLYGQLRDPFGYLWSIGGPG